jgi:hypothetical protein
VVERCEQQERADERADAEVEEQVLLREPAPGLAFHEGARHRKREVGREREDHRRLRRVEHGKRRVAAP